MRAFFFALAMGMGALAIGQTPASIVPTNSTIVVALNGGKITQDVSPADFQKYAFYKEIEKDFIRSSRKKIDGFNLEDMGIDMSGSSYYFFEQTDSITYHGFVAPVKSANIFGGFVENVIISKYNKGYRVMQGKGFSYIQDGDNVYAWNSKVGIIVESDASSSYFYRNEDVFARYNVVDSTDRWTKRRAIEKIWLAGKADQLFKADSKIADRLTKLQNEGDVVMWSSSAGTLNSYGALGGLYGMNKDYTAFMKKMEEYTKGNESVISLNFEQERLHLKSSSKLNDKSYNLANRLMSGKQNKNFLKYVRGGNLIGYYSISLNLSEALDASKEFYFPLAAEFPEYGKMSIDIVELIDLVIDEKELFKVWNGQALYACTGVRKFESTYYTYDYDENFEMIKTPHTKEETLPEMTLLLGTENEEAVQRIFRILEKTAGLVKKGTYYEITGNRDLPFTTYMAVHDGVVCLTNDKEIAATMHDGVKTQVSKEHAKNIKKYPSCMFFDPAQLMDDLPQEELFRNNRQIKTYQLMQANLSPIYGRQLKNKGNTVTYEMFMNTGQGKNALKFALDLVEEVYKIDKGPR